MSSFRPDFPAEERPFVPLAFDASASTADRTGADGTFQESNVLNSFADREERVETENVDSDVETESQENGRDESGAESGHDTTGTPNHEHDPERAAAWAALAAFEQAAFERGVAEGRAQGQEQQERLAAACQALEGAVKDVGSLGVTAVAAQRSLVLDLSAEIARQWVQAEFSLDSALFASALDRSIEACAGEEGLRVALSTTDFAELEAHQADRLAAWADTGSVELTIAGDLQPGQFRVESDSLRLDGDPDAIVAVLKDVLREALAAETSTCQESVS